MALLRRLELILSREPFSSLVISMANSIIALEACPLKPYWRIIAWGAAALISFIVADKTPSASFVSTRRRMAPFLPHDLSSDWTEYSASILSICSLTSAADGLFDGCGDSIRTRIS